MKFQLKDRSQWHRWFAWIPLINPDLHQMIWLQMVERRKCWCGDYEYREIRNEP